MFGITNHTRVYLRTGFTESLLELGGTKAELKPADLLQRLSGVKTEKLSAEQRGFFGILPVPAPPAPIRITQTAPVAKTKRKGGGWTFEHRAAGVPRQNP